MQFRYYITCLHTGSVQGTDDPEVAESLRHSEDYFVVDSESGLWLTNDDEHDIVDIDQSS